MFEAPKAPILILKDFLAKEFVNLQKWLFLRRDLFGWRLTRSGDKPSGPPKGVTYADASAEPTFSWSQTQHILFQKKDAPMGVLFEMVGMDAQFTSQLFRNGSMGRL